MSSNTKTINGRTYAFGTIPAMEAVQVEVSIARVLGEPLMRAIMDYKKTGLEKEEMQAAGVAAMGGIMSRMDPREITANIELVMKYVTCDGNRIDVNAHFTGKNRELWEVMWAALQFNFSDFLPESFFRSLREKLPSSLSGPRTSTTSSGAR